MKKLDLTTPDLTASNIDRIAELFPNVVTESRDEHGNVTRAVDFDLLRQELSDEVVEGPTERYRLDWPGKRAAAFAANAPINKTLRPVRDDSVDFDTTQNLFIEGDNLDALKLLQESYLGKVKLIYIDPPYNTGHDFIYKDNFAQTSAEYLEASGQTDDEGNRLVANTESNGRFHSDWLSMMYPRLKLARNLLSEDGVIFISIDDGEVAQVREICDQVFGVSNFIATFVWEKRTTRENRRAFSISHDYLVCTARSKPAFEAGRGLLPLSDAAAERYSNPDRDPRGEWQSVSLNAQAGHAVESQFYEITTPGGRILSPPPGRCWSVTRERLEELIADNRVWFGRDGTNVPRLKHFRSESADGLTPHTLWKAAEVGTNDSAKKQFLELGNVALFDTPKPVNLLKRMVEIGAHPTDSLVLDFFAGSGTTAHAVMAQNAADGGNRRFIMVQLDEATDEKSAAHDAGYHTIAELSRERIRRAGQMIKDEAGLAGSDLDVGFRALRIDSTNMADVLRTPDETAQLELDQFEGSIKADRTGEDLVFQVLLDWGLELSMPIQVEKLEGAEVFTVDGGALIACFDTPVTTDLARAIAKRQPLRAVFRDSAFEADDARINVEQIFKELSPDTDVRVI